MGQFLEGVAVMSVIRIGIGKVSSFGHLDSSIPCLVNWFAFFRPEVLDSSFFFLEFKDDLPFVFQWTTIDDHDLKLTFLIEGLVQQILEAATNEVGRVVGWDDGTNLQHQNDAYAI